MNKRESYRTLSIIFSVLLLSLLIKVGNSVELENVELQPRDENNIAIILVAGLSEADTVDLFVASELMKGLTKKGVEVSVVNGEKGLVEFLFKQMNESDTRYLSRSANQHKAILQVNAYKSVVIPGTYKYKEKLPADPLKFGSMPPLISGKSPDRTVERTVDGFIPGGIELKTINAYQDRLPKDFHLPSVHPYDEVPLKTALPVASDISEHILANLHCAESIFTVVQSEPSWVANLDVCVWNPKWFVLTGGRAHVYSEEYSSGTWCEIINISNPRFPFGTKGFVMDTTEYGFISSEAAKDYAICETREGFDIFDITSSQELSKISSCERGKTSINSIDLTEKYIYVCTTEGLEIIDITNPLLPNKIGFCKAKNKSGLVRVVENYAYIADIRKGLMIVDISEPGNPHLVGRCKFKLPRGYHDIGKVSGVRVVGNYVLVAGDLYLDQMLVINVANPSAPRICLSYRQDKDDIWGCRAIEVVGDFAYLAQFKNRVKIINIANPRNPEFVRYLTLPGPARDLHVSGSYLYVLCYGEDLIGSTLQIYDIEKSSHP